MCSRCEPWNILYDDFLNEFACISTQCWKEVIQIYMFKVHSYLCILEIKYICNTYTTGDIQFICMRFNNRYVSGMFRSECKLILYFFCLPTLLIFIHIEHRCSFFVAFFSATIGGRNLIFGHKLHIGMPYCGKRFWTRQIPTSCLPT